MYILRRKKLGKTSTSAIVALSQNKDNIAVIRNDSLDGREFDEDSILFRWGCTSQVPVKNVVNKADAIHLTSDKIAFRRLMDEHNIGSLRSFMSHADYNLTYPCIVRPKFHSQGRRLHVCDNVEQLRTVCGRYGEGNYYISPKINKTNEFRVFVVSGRVICVAEKFPANADAVAWNVAQGGRFENVNWNNWPLKVVKTAIEAFNVADLDFGGVDVMTDADGNVYVLEINAAPSLTSPYRQECMSKAFDFIIEFGKKRIPITKEKGGYRKFIHPCVCDEAIVPQQA